MVYAMKTILSYFEKQRDRILSDYLYVLCIPLIVTFYLLLFIFKKVYSNLSYMIKHPADLIGFFYSLHRIVLDYDPLVDQIVLHDENYDKKMTQNFEKEMTKIAPGVLNSIKSLLDFEKS